MAQGQSDPVECVEQRHHGFPQGTSAYFRKAQYGKHRPRFASRNDNIQSFRNAMPIRRMDGNRYPLSRKLGSVRIRKRDRLRHPIESLSSWTVKRENRTYCLVLLFDVDIQPKTRAEGRVGIDLGVKDLLTLSTGEKIDYPNRLRRLEEDVKREQRKLSRRTTGSNNYRRQRAIVAKAYAKLRRYRDNFQHQLSHRLIEENQFIGMETLMVRNMMRKAKKNAEGIRSGQSRKRAMNRSILRDGWSGLVDKLSYKAEWCMVASSSKWTGSIRVPNSATTAGTSARDCGCPNANGCANGAESRTTGT